ncbi:MAG: DNA-binding response regulator [Bacteroidetes bacterium SW_4_67_19]|jgi:two-component system LytT family response regulator|nr:MAG: DNA-binding response regulator [Bacteroidetes bacterium SW_4_67_19]
MRVLIVDDEPLARRRLRQLLSGRDDVDLAGEAENGREAARLIEEEAPDLVFLDVQMPGLDGVDVIREIGPQAMPPTVFVTAYDQYALEAFRLAALDYLVKPFDDERFEEAFARAREQVRLHEKSQTADRLLTLLENESGETPTPDAPQTAPSSYLERIAVETPGRTRIVSVTDIDYITADGSYAELHLGGGERYPIRERMKTLEERLDPEVFFRIHRSTIVRLERVDSLLTRSGGRYAVELDDGTRLKVSRSRREDLQEHLGLLR